MSRSRRRGRHLPAGLALLTLAALAAPVVAAAEGRTVAPPGPPATDRVATVAAAYPNPGRVTGDVGVHDPALVKRPDGSYLLAATGDNVPLRVSGDRTNFRFAGVAFPNGAPWTTSYTRGSRNLWAPDLTYRNGLYWLYYSASTFGSNTSAIFLATSPSGNPGTWTHRGRVVSTASNNSYNAIDPNLFVDSDGSWWLSFGSFWSGIKLVRINPATGLRADGAMASIAGRPSAGGAIEAPYIVKRGGWYYLFSSFDRCCQGARSTYRTMVARSTSITGPYVDRSGRRATDGGGSEILAGHDAVYGPGHPGVLQDVDADVLTYHYYRADGSSTLGINLLRWDAGWPVVY